MSLKKATPKAVFDACEQLELLDRSWNRDDVRLVVGGGSFSVIDPLVQAWRKLQPIREVAPSVPADLLIQVATMLEQQVSTYIKDIDERDSEREQALLVVSEELAGNLHQVESDLTGQLELAQQANHDLEAEHSRLSVELDERSRSLIEFELKLQSAKEGAELLAQRLQEQQEFYELALKQQKQSQKESEARLLELGQQQLNNLKLEAQQQLAQQKESQSTAAELAENRLMRLLDQARSEIKEQQLSSASKLEVLGKEQQVDKQLVNRQKLEINVLKAELIQVGQNSDQQISMLEQQLLKTEQQLSDQSKQGLLGERGDLQAIKASILALQGQMESQNK